MTRSKDSSGNVTRVESFALERFRGLNADMGLSGPKVIRDRWNTTLVYQGRDVALEVELDWRDLAVFVMLVRLYEGKVPPGGYAGPDGKRVYDQLELEVLINENSLA